MKTKKTFLTIAAIAVIFSNALVAQTKKPAPPKNGSGTQKNAPASRPAPKQNPNQNAKPKPNPNQNQRQSAKPNPNQSPKQGAKPNPNAKQDLAARDAANWDIKSLDTARKVDYLSEIEKDVILEMNKARTNPKKYAELYLVPFAKKFRSDGTYMKNGVMMLTNEGVAVVNECIKEMVGTKPMGVLQPAKGLALAAQGHATTQAAAGQIGHDGVDGSTPFTRIEKYGTYRAAAENIAYGANTGRDIVMQLLIDDGVKNRGHRKTILASGYTHTGSGYAEGHKIFKTECVVTYAWRYEENN